MSKPEHWTRRLKRELAEAKTIIREISRNPEGEVALRYRMLTKIEGDTNRLLWLGTHGGAGRGIMDMMNNVEFKRIQP